MADASRTTRGALSYTEGNTKALARKYRIVDGAQQGNLLRHARMLIDKRLHIVLCISRANKDQTEIRLDVPQLFGSFQD